jgi:pimeloyl-ACP methyl ester carboxylesterase
MPAIRHRKIDAEGLLVFVREAGEPAQPAIVLLPGYPSSTRAYVRFIDRLAPDWHVVAIDYPGFGSSDPLPESPTFDRLAEVTGKAIDTLGIGDYAIYMFDFGSPVGFRIALRHDQRVRAVVSCRARRITARPQSRAWGCLRRPSTPSRACRTRWLRRSPRWALR